MAKISQTVNFIKIVEFYEKLEIKLVYVYRLLLIITKNKGVINMNKLTKIGLTALAGSLVATLHLQALCLLQDLHQ